MTATLNAAEEPSRSLGSDEMLRVSGITYRQLDHWTSKGWLRVVSQGRVTPRTAVRGGPGYKRTWQAGEDHVALVMHALTLIGVRPEKAVEFARKLKAYYPVGVEVFPGLTITLDAAHLEDGVRSRGKSDG